MEKLLLEIGAEEIPAGYIAPALKALSTNLKNRLSAARITHGEARIYGTPRHLAVMIDDVATRQKTMGMPVVECKQNKLIATARCHPKEKADNRGVAEGEDGYFNGTTDLPVGIHIDRSEKIQIHSYKSKRSRK